MLREYLSNAAVQWPLFAFGMFFSVFVLVLVRAWRRPQEADAPLASLPLESENTKGEVS